jgi:small subunit ribosomal protein S1
MADDLSMNPSRDDFAALLDESIGGGDFGEGQVVHGKVAAIEKDFAIIDVGLKTEGRVSLKEFGMDEGKAELKAGDSVEVFLERVENALGEAVISRDKARREEAWTRLEEVYGRNEPVMGSIVGRVKGGFTVDLGGASAFLPGSQVDIRPVRDVGPLMGREQPFAILKMDRPRGNIVVSRRAILEEARAEQRTELVSQLQEGEVREGVVKNITDYGAFVDLGGIDGLLHVTDMSWKRVNHPSQVLAVGDTVKVQIVKINPETQRISLGMKQLQSDPWDGVEAKYPVGAKFKGRITNITDYGAFVDLGGIDGLLHVTDIAWRRVNHPTEVLNIGQTEKVKIFKINHETHRISLGMKQLQQDPWSNIEARYAV